MFAITPHVRASIVNKELVQEAMELALPVLGIDFNLREILLLDYPEGRVVFAHLKDKICQYVKDGRQSCWRRETDCPLSFWIDLVSQLSCAYNHIYQGPNLQLRVAASVQFARFYLRKLM
ncbi:hypothetical protein FB451DRAFT_1161507 [Mycena latifolia]|nr:hypothetical protein FB451DRAFT_1161507 [Mycena latifolia]